MLLLEKIDEVIRFVVLNGSNATVNVDFDHLTCSDLAQSAEFKRDGFCVLNDTLLRSQISLLVRGYVRTFSSSSCCFPEDALLLMIAFFHCRFNEQSLVQLSFTGLSTSFLISREHVRLSAVMTAKMEAESVSDAAIELDDEKLVWPPLQHVFRYLAHHKCVEPDPLPCPVRSIHMAQICADRFDAEFMDSFSKKQVFEIILQANELKIKSLLHLGCAKIATLIKQMDQKEINRVIEEEERYRREHAKRQDQDEDQDDEDEEHVLEIDQVALRDDVDGSDGDDDAESEAAPVEQTEDIEEQLLSLNYSALDIQETSSLVKSFSHDH